MTVQETRREFNQRLCLTLRLQPDPSMGFAHWWRQNHKELCLFPESPHSFSGMLNETRNYQLRVSYRWLWRELRGEEMPSQETLELWQRLVRQGKGKS